MPITYKCPSCGAAMTFDSASQMLHCAQCGTRIDVGTYEQQYGALYEETQEEQDTPQSETSQTESAGSGAEQDGTEGPAQESGEPYDTMNMKVYHCQSCGAELLSDEYTSAVICSFCGNPSLVEDRLEGAYKPQYIIPFKIDRGQAKEIYRRWVKKGPLTPKALSLKSTIEKISGIYVPFWLYDYGAESQMTVKATRIRTRRSGNTEYIYTDHYHVFRDIEADFKGLPADASEKMQDDAMDKMEPYDYRGLADFKMPYLSGYLSERYNFTDAEIEERAARRIRAYITEIARNTIIGYSSVAVLDNQIRLDKKSSHYALMPVWVLNCRYEGKEFQFMLNGQTGKIVADRPISKKRAAAWGIGIFAGLLLIQMIGGLMIL